MKSYLACKVIGSFYYRCGKNEYAIKATSLDGIKLYTRKAESTLGLEDSRPSSLVRLLYCTYTDTNSPRQGNKDIGISASSFVPGVQPVYHRLAGICCIPSEITSMNLIERTGTKLKEMFSARGLILMYHRVSEPDLDPWGLSISPTHFNEQLEVIHKYFHPLRMQELLMHLRHGKVPNRSIVVSFDDGYADNLHLAKPLLERSGVPATVFIVTEAIIKERTFWWDELEWALLEPGTLPGCLELKVNGSRYEWQLGDARWYSRQDRQKDHWRRPWDALPGTRLAFFYSIWQRLLKLSRPAQLEALDAIRTWAGASDALRSRHRALSEDEVHILGEGGLIELGAHTMSHPSLQVLSASQQMEEISGSKSELENIIGLPVKSFSYPHGEYSLETVELVQKAGFEGASTTNFRCVRSSADPFQLPRFQIEDWNGEEFLRRLARWYALS
jgi:peptidoglycan/xylan/chitin deacetylase (PgdA/CDA1 family)